MLSRAEILARAREHVGHREVTPNSSPLIDDWLSEAGVDLKLPPERKPWCAAFASWCIEARNVRGWRYAGALSLGMRYADTRNPQPGDLMWFPTDAKGAGHIGVVMAGVGLDEVLCIEGNSDNSVRYVRRMRSEVRFSSVRDEPMLLPDGSSIPAPLVRVSHQGTR
jgi:uncharacterized protein (TIGR02594 family)